MKQIPDEDFDSLPIFFFLLAFSEQQHIKDYA
jgi:hypothetical protein